MMKIVLLILLLQISCPMNSAFDKLLGTWQIEKVVNNPPEPDFDCGNVTDYTLTFNSDSTYVLFGGSSEYITNGKWLIVGDKINFYDSEIPNSNNSIVADHEYSFSINEQGILIIDEYMCSEFGGKTYYKRIK